MLALVISRHTTDPSGAKGLLQVDEPSGMVVVLPDVQL